MTSSSHQFRQKPAPTAEQEENLINLDEESPPTRSPALQRATNIEVPVRSAPPRQKGPVPCDSMNTQTPATPSTTILAPAPAPNPTNATQPSHARTEAEKARLQKSRDEHARFFAAQEEQARLYGYVQHNPRHGPPQAVNPSTFSTVSLTPVTPNDGLPPHLPSKANAADLQQPTEEEAARFFEERQQTARAEAAAFQQARLDAAQRQKEAYIARAEREHAEEERAVQETAKKQEISQRRLESARAAIEVVRQKREEARVRREREGEEKRRGVARGKLGVVKKAAGQEALEREQQKAKVVLEEQRRDKEAQDLFERAKVRLETAPTPAEIEASEREAKLRRDKQFHAAQKEEEQRWLLEVAKKEAKKREKARGKATGNTVSVEIVAAELLAKRAQEEVAESIRLVRAHQAMKVGFDKEEADRKTRAVAENEMAETEMVQKEIAAINKAVKEEVLKEMMPNDTARTELATKEKAAEKIAEMAKLKAEMDGCKKENNEAGMKYMRRAEEMAVRQQAEDEREEQRRRAELNAAREKAERDRGAVLQAQIAQDEREMEEEGRRFAKARTAEERLAKQNARAPELKVRTKSYEERKAESTAWLRDLETRKIEVEVQRQLRRDVEIAIQKKENEEQLRLYQQALAKAEDTRLLERQQAAYARDRKSREDKLLAEKAEQEQADWLAECAQAETDTNRRAEQEVEIELEGTRKLNNRGNEIYQEAVEEERLKRQRPILEQFEEERFQRERLREESLRATTEEQDRWALREKERHRMLLAEEAKREKEHQENRAANEDSKGWNDVRDALAETAHGVVWNRRQRTRVQRAQSIGYIGTTEWQASRVAELEQEWATRGGVTEEDKRRELAQRATDERREAEVKKREFLQKAVDERREAEAKQREREMNLREIQMAKREAMLQAAERRQREAKQAIIDIEMEKRKERLVIGRSEKGRTSENCLLVCVCGTKCLD